MTPKESLPTPKPDTEIPWDSIVERKLMSDVTWRTPQGNLQIACEEIEGKTPDQAEIEKLTNARPRQLEKVVLANGLRYTLIRDGETGEEVFDSKIYEGIHKSRDGIGYVSLRPVTPIVGGTDLGQGYVLDYLQIQRKWGMPSLETYVSKTRDFRDNDNQVGQMNLEYEMDPHAKEFSARFRLWDRKKFIKFAMNVSDSLHDPRLSHRLTLTFRDDTPVKQAELGFDTQAELSEITIFPRQEVLRYTGEEVKGEGRIFSTVLLGLEYSESVQLDTRQTLNNLLENMDAKTPQDPRTVFSYRKGIKAHDPVF